MKIFSKRKQSNTIANNVVFKSRDKRKHSLGLALSGGGARGFAHIGAFKAFQEAGLQFDYVAGTSVGSIMGAAYCAGYSWEQMREYSLTIRDRDVLSSRWLKINNRPENVQKIVANFIGDCTFEQLQIPFACVAVDIVSGSEIVLNSGNVPKAVSASCAVPGVFRAVEMGKMRLVDGGLLNNIPADVVRNMGADMVISVDLNHTRGEGTNNDGFWSTMNAVWRILMKGTAFKGQHNSDLMIEPELRIFSNSTIKDVDNMIAEGYRATLYKLEEIYKLINY